MAKTEPVTCAVAVARSVAVTRTVAVTASVAAVAEASVTAVQAIAAASEVSGEANSHEGGENNQGSLKYMKYVLDYEPENKTANYRTMRHR